MPRGYLRFGAEIHDDEPEGSRLEQPLSRTRPRDDVAYPNYDEGIEVDATVRQVRWVERAELERHPGHGLPLLLGFEHDPRGGGGDGGSADGGQLGQPAGQLIQLPPRFV